MAIKTKTKPKGTGVAAPTIMKDDSFDLLATAVRARFLAFREGPLLSVSTDGLYEAYLAFFSSPAERQHHTCSACSHFLRHYGGAVAVLDSGRIVSALWSAIEVPQQYAASVRAMCQLVESRPIERVLLSAEKVWGIALTPDPQSGVDWTHFCLSGHQVFRHPLKSASQMAAEKREDMLVLATSVSDFSRDTVAKAKALLEGEQLYRSEKLLGVADWFLKLLDSLPKHKAFRQNLLWRAAATAPAGFTHVRNTMIGTLLADMECGEHTFAAVQQRFVEKMNPLRYQRPTALPSAGQVGEAERVIATLRSAGALERRFAKLEDIQFLWRPRGVARPAVREGVFRDVPLRHSAPVAPDPIGATTTMTLEKFGRTVLPTAERIELQVPSIGSFIALITAVQPEAPAMLQWDFEDARNPVSWYVYPTGSSARQWNLQTGAWVTVTGIALSPNMWNADRPQPQQSERWVLTLEGCRDTNLSPHGGLFVECLKSEYHAAKRTLEHHMGQTVVAGGAEATACGYCLQKDGGAGRHTYDVLVRVTSGGLQQTYRLDRWD